MATSSDGGIPRPDRVLPTPLRTLADELRWTGVDPEWADQSEVVIGRDVAVTGITASSKYVRPGDLFAALPGARAHGVRFAAQARAAGAVALLTDRAGLDQLDGEFDSVLVVEDVRDRLGRVSAKVYGSPSSYVAALGVTGTSGKTTTTFLMRAGLQAAGRVPGLIGTVATMIGDDEIKTGFTTPEAPELQALLAVMRERGVTDVAMEVSSHALALGRVGGTWFRTAGFTNLSEDHLDFHETIEEYFKAKASLFLNQHYTDRPVVVVDDHYGDLLSDMLGGPAVTASGWDNPSGTWRATRVVERPDGSTTFRVVGPDGHLTRRGPIEIDMGCAIPGRYNVANAVLALALLYEDGVDPIVAAPAIAAASVPGRMERIDAGQPYLAVVDYSHKPAAVDGALRALRPLTRGKLIIVLGCGGDRDRGKRPHMGAIAARDADVLVVTDDNPRSEDPAAIRRAMLDGALGVPAAERGEVIEVAGRADAIAAAVERVGAGDTVLVAGKGHETGQEIAGVVHPFDDRTTLRAAVEAHR
ncbi:UDP-N-acetylmuramoyl-L-alanyl-D-glutamate--2,6-diaminopimelate ligase [uncultured Jatrophihabitans sp.]|uniref:UDP-N-acetylmuramoyl-L-alanyl-D-glutamate--2, 6-diaminopimelate ligase n=1 Tax=uncultured Jatrophihabitans sp. TaxID=1610747 RepID=UPI0035CB488F